MVLAYEGLPQLCSENQKSSTDIINIWFQQPGSILLVWPNGGLGYPKLL